MTNILESIGNAMHYGLVQFRNELDPMFSINDGKTTNFNEVEHIF